MPATILGTMGNDVILGTPAADVIIGFAGDDEIRGRGGDDVICGGVGDDHITGGPGRDLLVGQSGDDRLYGGDSGDRLSGGPGDDLLDGEAGRDVLDGDLGDDLLIGGPGDDALRGREGDDRLEGRSGADRLWGHDGDDRLIGGSEDDRLLGGAGNDVVSGGVGSDKCRAEAHDGCEVVAVGPGDDGPAVEGLQRALADAALYRGPIDGSFGTSTSFAVVAFHKVLGLPRTTAWAHGDWARLARFRAEPPINRPGEPDRVEVDIGRQVLFVVESGAVSAVIPVSTGNGASYENRFGLIVRSVTPRGDFTFRRHVTGWEYNYLGGLYESWYFTSAYAVHGSRSVPPWPASHGCVRVPVWESDWLSNGHLFVGMPIHVWDRV